VPIRSLIDDSKRTHMESLDHGVAADKPRTGEQHPSADAAAG
jgi:hypothetical protein